MTSCHLDVVVLPGKFNMEHRAVFLLRRHEILSVES